MKKFRNLLLIIPFHAILSACASLELSTVGEIEEAKKSTATIVLENGYGSGFFVAEDLLVTNAHVVADAEDRIVFFATPDGSIDSGKVVVYDSDNDLAIIKTSESSYKALEMGNAEELKIGDEIYVIGSPEGFYGSLSKGIISAKWSEDIQITAPISQGSSGSPVFSKDFKVVGIAYQVRPATAFDDIPQNLNFVIPINKLQILMQNNKLTLEENYEAEDETPKNMFHIGSYYGKGVAEDYHKAIDWYKEAANQGHADAQNWLGEMYYKGDKDEGVAEDYHKAIYWYKEAANQGHANAQNWLGKMYYEGDKDEGVAENYQEAIKWFEKAANQGHALAQNNLGKMYYYGKGVAEDYYKAIDWFEKAANQGHANAQNWLGTMYYIGDKDEGVAKNYHKAIYWYKEAANQGHANAQNNLGRMYYKGEGVAENYHKAHSWYKEAANQGHALAQKNLGRMYYNGEGVAKNYIEAYKWLILSKAQEDNEKLDKLKKSMTLYQIVKAEELVRQFKRQEN